MDTEKKVKRKSVYLTRLMGKFSPMIIVILLLAVVDSTGYTYVPLFIKYIIAILGNENVSVNLPKAVVNLFNSGSTIPMKVLIASLGLAFFQLLRGILKFIIGVFRQFTGETIIKKMRIELYEHIQNLPYSYHNNVDTGDLIQRCTTDTETIKSFLTNQLSEMISTFAAIFASVYQMYKINHQLTFVSLILIPIILTSSIIFKIYIEKKFTEIEESDSRLMGIIQENLAGVKEVKAFTNENYENERFIEQSKDYARKNLQLNKVAALFWGFSDFTSVCQYLLTTAVAIFIVRNNPDSISASDVVALVMLVGNFVWPVRSLARIIGDMGKSVVSSGRLQEVMNFKEEHINDSNRIPEIKGGITFDNVSFKFDDTEQHLLDGLSFIVNPGETVAIVGKTGSGKSTIAKLLVRMHEYTDGSIKIDGYELNNINKKYVRSKIGLVLQEPFLFARTVYENIAITKKDIEKSKVVKAAQISAIARDIEGFEKGYDTVVGEKGTTLSGGQKQRLAIARMLIKEKPIIIFDDSLSAVDSETDLMIRNALKQEEYKATMIIITHRITTAKQADKIIVLENGKAVQIGTHETLANVPGLYKKLWDIQGEIEEEFMKILHEGDEK